jgi:hypothetical protein
MVRSSFRSRLAGEESLWFETGKRDSSARGVPQNDNVFPFRWSIVHAEISSLTLVRPLREISLRILIFEDDQREGRVSVVRDGKGNILDAEAIGDGAGRPG